MCIRDSIIIVDTGAGISEAVLEFASYSSDIILVTSPEPTSITDAYALLKSLNKREDFDREQPVKMLTNRVETVKDGRELYEKLNIVVQRFLDVKVDFLGAVPMDMNVSKAVMRQTPFTMAFPNTAATKAVEQIAKKLAGTARDEHKEKKGIVYLFSNFIRKNQ